MTKHSEPIPFMGIVEIDDDEVSNTQPMTQQEIANELGETRSAVNYIERQAMQKFKAKFLRKFNKDDFI
jgi:DNA-directed RNA polymerase sigma subunit (sigma70/sigma32)